MTPKLDGGYSALWHHWGAYGDQNVHVHPYIDDDERALVGPGRDCDPAVKHQRMHWSPRVCKWVNDR